jgi:hypothetical protein
MLDKLRIARYHFVLQAVEPIHLPPHKGSSLRGGFGQAFKRMACRKPNGCSQECEQPEECAYGYVFETSPPPDSEVLRTHQAVPRPFVFEVIPDGKTDFRPGEELTFGLVLIGQGIAHLPFFILAFKALGEEGLGKGRGRFQVKQVWAFDPLGPWKTLIYDGASDALRNVDMSIGIAEIEAAAVRLSTEEAVVHFLTPTRIKHAGEIVHELPFHVLVRSIMRRVSSLTYFHCGQRWETDYRGMIEAAKVVEVAHTDLRWQDWRRHSGRQGQQIEMGGVVGIVRYTGPLTNFRMLLVIGSLIHVGKGTVFGNGQFNIE